jgi:hypothetical protein
MFLNKDYLFKKFKFNSPILKKEIEAVEKTLSIKFPNDYVEFMLSTNGGCGFLGQQGYLDLWKIETLVQGNHEYLVHEFAPSLVVIGTNGAGLAYGYDFREDIPTLVEVDFIGLDTDIPDFISHDFLEFIEYCFNISNQS